MTIVIDNEDRFECRIELPLVSSLSMQRQSNSMPGLKSDGEDENVKQYLNSVKFERVSL
jgi:hypothetical protein